MQLPTTQQAKGLQEAKPASEIYLTRLKKTTALSDEQERLIVMKYAAPPYNRLSDVDKIRTAKKIIFRISVITGWLLPDEKLTLEVLYNEMSKKMAEDYGDLNEEEIAYAVRNYGTTIKDWNKNFNLSMLDEVMIKYRSRRMELSRMEEMAANATRTSDVKQLAPIVDEEVLINTAKTIYLQTRNVGLIITKVYDILLERNEIELTLDEKKAIRLQVINKLEGEAMRDGAIAMRDYKLLKLNKIRFEDKVRNECKRYAVARYFDIQKGIDEF